MYAIIETGGKQYRVQPGDTLDIELLELAEGQEKVEFDRVLLVGEGETVHIGTPARQRRQGDRQEPGRTARAEDSRSTSTSAARVTICTAAIARTCSASRSTRSCWRKNTDSLIRPGGPA